MDGLQIRAVVASDECDLVVAVEIFDLGQEVLNLVRFLHADAVGQFGQHAAVDGVHADELGGGGVGDERLVEEGVKRCTIRDLYTQDLVRHFTCEPVETGHEQHDQTDDNGRNHCQQIELGADCHPNRHSEEDETDVASLFDGIAEADDGQCAHERERTRNV